MKNSFGAHVANVFRRLFNLGFGCERAASPVASIGTALPRLLLASIILALVVLALPALAQPVPPLPPGVGFGLSTSSSTAVFVNAGNDGSEVGVVVTANNASSYPPVVRFLSATGVNATNKVVVWSAPLTGTNVFLVSTNYTFIQTNSQNSAPTLNLTNFYVGNDCSDLPGGSFCIYRHTATDVYDPFVSGGAGIAAGVGSTNNITTQAVLSSLPVAGDMVYVMAKEGTIPVGNATIGPYYGGPLIYGTKPQYPLFIGLLTTSAAQGVTLNIVGGNFLP